MRRTVERKQHHPIDDRPSMRMPLQTSTNNDDGNSGSDSGDNDDDGGGGGGSKEEDKGIDAQTTIN